MASMAKLVARSRELRGRLAERESRDDDAKRLEMRRDGQMAYAKVNQASIEREAILSLSGQLTHNSAAYLTQGISTSELVSTMRRVAGFLEDLGDADAYTRRISAKILTHRD